jgi:minor extracellular serine protease Vpr
MHFRKIIGFFLFLGSSQLLFGQVKFSATDQVYLQQATLKKIKQEQQESMISMLIVYNNQFDKRQFENQIGKVGAMRGKVARVIVPSGKIDVFKSFKGIEFAQIARKIKADLDKSVKDIGADSVHLGIQLPQGYHGTNVYIGITDWGFDYTSPNFYDTLLQHSRIAAAWDQFKMSGPAPNGFDYGTVFQTEEELLLAQSDTSNVYGYGTHGTHVAGIAAGSGAGTVHRGTAPNAQLLLVTFLVDEGAVFDAWEWMFQKAQADGKRLVINMSWGLYHFGTLDGTSLLSQAISDYTDEGVVFVNSGGNNGNVNFHLKKEFNNDEIKSRVEFYSYSANPNMWGQSIHAWGTPSQPFESGFYIANSSGLMLLESPFYATHASPAYIDSMLVYGNDTILFNVAVDAAHPLNNRPHIRLRVRCLNTNLRIVYRSRAVSGLVHYWNVTELSNDVGNWGMPFSFLGAGTVSGDSQYGISEPSCADDVISVAAYTPFSVSGSGNISGGSIANFSSSGPRYDEVMKPDVAAPGVSIASSMSSFTTQNFSSLANVPFNGRTYHFARLSGTSMASPVVAGVAALLLEANPYLTARQVKEIIMLSARKDANTGIIPENGSVRWGSGKVNAYQAVKLALTYVGHEELSQQEKLLVIPNPTADKLQILESDFTGVAMLISMEGKVHQTSFSNGYTNIPKDCGEGQYILRWEENGRIKQVKIIKSQQ